MRNKFIFLFLLLSWCGFVRELKADNGACIQSLREVSRYLTAPLFASTDGVFERWPIDGIIGSDDWGYHNYFRVLLNEESIDAFVVERRRHEKETNVLDLFGSANFTWKPHLYNSLTGVRAYPFDPEHIPFGYETANWSEIVGTIFSPTTWVRLDEDMRRREIGSFDLIIIRPMGPLADASKLYISHGNSDHISSFLAINARMLNRAWSRISSEGGIMLVQLTSAIEESAHFQSWRDKLQKRHIQFEIDRAEHSSCFEGCRGFIVLKLVKESRDQTI